MNSAFHNGRPVNLCSRCVLPGSFPGINMDPAGVCNFCREASGPATLKEQKALFKEKFLSLINAYRGRAAYDCIMAFSGGKDSTYTMLVLRRDFNLRVLALTIDNGFVSDAALRNMRLATEALSVDHMIFRPRPDLLKTVFLKAMDEDIYPKKTLERASTICTSCISVVKFLTLKTAIEKGIMLVGYGWSPGQAPVNSSVMRTNPALMKAAQATVLEPLKKAAGPDISAYFLNDGHFALKDGFPYNIHPLAFLDYNEREILREIGKLGWSEPDDTDSNSTNCLLNALANDVHIKRQGFHPYVWEIANMVRAGIMTREEGFKKIYGGQPETLINEALRRLGIG